ncbi:hypothetical protein PR048_030234 [Dryococelus australis]|uniref:Uncharacterized protein n=1 Tax=Dryococelus australis TaxID=614101 RepID=A0ABQ9G8F1_9NEOP|nr:hypothetical protein PR048_030234 [Dryococelus australis]
MLARHEEAPQSPPCARSAIVREEKLLNSVHDEGSPVSTTLACRRHYFRITLQGRWHLGVESPSLIGGGGSCVHGGDCTELVNAYSVVRRLNRGRGDVVARPFTSHQGESEVQAFTDRVRQNCVTRYLPVSNHQHLVKALANDSTANQAEETRGLETRLSDSRREPGSIPGGFVPGISHVGIMLRARSMLRALQISSPTHLPSLPRANQLRNRLVCSPPTEANRVQSPAGSLPNFRKRESCRTMPLMAVFLRDLPFPLPLNPSVPPFSPHFTLIGSQDRAIKGYPNLSTQPNRELRGIISIASPAAMRTQMDIKGPMYLRVQGPLSNYESARRVPKSEMPSLSGLFLAVRRVRSARALVPGITGFPRRLGTRETNTPRQPRVSPLVTIRARNIALRLPPCKVAEGCNSPPSHANPPESAPGLMNSPGPRDVVRDKTRERLLRLVDVTRAALHVTKSTRAAPSSSLHVPAASRYRFSWRGTSLAAIKNGAVFTRSPSRRIALQIKAFITSAQLSYYKLLLCEGRHKNRTSIKTLGLDNGYLPRVRFRVRILRGPSSEHGAALECVSAGKRRIPEETRRPAASSGAIPTCENPGAAPIGNRTRFVMVEGEGYESEHRVYIVVQSPFRAISSELGQQRGLSVTSRASECTTFSANWDTA